jgi:uncharacterized protein
MSEPGSEKGDVEKAPDGGKPERLDTKLLEFLVCPITKSSLIYDEARQELISRSARLAYPIRRGVPHLLAAEARSLDDEERV